MAITVNESESESLVVLEGTVDISSSAELKAALVQALESAKAVRISLERAAYLDVTAFQLLWAAEQQARRSGVAFGMAGQIPDVVSGALADAGFPSIPAAMNAG
ncbi:MAG: STAS domain-containing protein [Terracidiphilus sp.]